MKNIHMITGMPRAGSTLLCRILSQNPVAFASDTSGVFNTLMAATHVMSAADEYKSDLINNRDIAMARHRNVQRGIVQNSYDHIQKVIFDKSRSWGAQASLVQRILPESKLIVMVRDIKAVVASVEKNHLETIEIDPDAMGSPTLKDRIEAQLAPGAIIGGTIGFVLDMVHRSVGNTIILKYEDLAQHPEKTMNWLYGRLNMEPFEHDFENVECSATDQDGLYWYKFSHSGGKTVEFYDNVDKYLPQLMQADIDDGYREFNSVFGYGEAGDSDGNVTSIHRAEA